MRSDVFSARAECLHDVDVFRRALRREGWRVRMPTRRISATDVSLELRPTQPMDIETVRDILRRRVPDSHVVLQTLRPCPLSQNSLERDYDQE